MVHVTQSVFIHGAPAAAVCYAAAVLNCYWEGFQDLPAIACILAHVTDSI
jgi:hypothetical protein